MISILLSKISISIALIGLSINVIFIKPYPGVAIIGNENKLGRYKFNSKMGYLSNLLIFAGTGGQLVSLFLH